jgi:hypothetical protein
MHLYQLPRALSLEIKFADMVVSSEERFFFVEEYRHTDLFFVAKIIHSYLVDLFLVTYRTFLKSTSFTGPKNQDTFNRAEPTTRRAKSDACHFLRPEAGLSGSFERI